MAFWDQAIFQHRVPVDYVEYKLMASDKFTFDYKMYGLEIELGAGTFYPTFGALAGVGYSFQFHSLFASAGYRWNWAYDINPIGEAWWLEPRFTAGVKLW